MEGLLQLLELQHIFILIFGVLLGIFVGALPGLTPTMGVALCIPFTFSMSPLAGLIMLGGIYCGSVYGGTIPAIMFNVPGAPASVATTFDGYPMARQGKARKALELATIASCIGGLVGMAMLIFFSPFFVNFSLRFGPTENFWIAIFGISVIAAISEGSVSKEFLGGTIGVLLSFIGISSFTGQTRYTLGVDALVGGLNVVAVLIGLFAFPQALRLIEQLFDKQPNPENLQTHSKSTARQSFLEIIKKPKAISIGSIVGGITGVIPGAGGNIASILAYNEVKRFSKNKHQFGKGNSEGIIATESANNAMVGGSLIPLLTLGIPGSPTAAIFLGGLLIHGIWPGRNLFVDNSSLVYGFFASMIMAQLLMLVIGLACVKHFTKLNQIPNYIIAPAILTFCIIGAYATQNNLVDIYTVVIVGILMYSLQKFNFSPAPIALGFILGPIAEEGLLQGIHVGEANGSPWLYFFTGTYNITLIGLLTITILIAVWHSLKKRTIKRESTAFSLRNYVSYNGVIWLFTIITGVSIYLFTRNFELEQRLFPQITLLLFILCACIEFYKLGFQSKKPLNERLYHKLTLWMFIFYISILCLLTSYIGFYTQVFLLLISVPLYAYFKKVATLSIHKLTLLSVCYTFFMYVLFTILLKVPLPEIF